MSKTVFCQKLQMEALALATPPFPGELGERIQKEISKPAWDLWINHQTMLINEYRLNLMTPEARQFLTKEMRKFLFEGGSETPPGFQVK
jgi:Fe-S cluster biosynthesis and repair protein YggX